MGSYLVSSRWRCVFAGLVVVACVAGTEPACAQGSARENGAEPQDAVKAGKPVAEKPAAGEPAAAAATNELDPALQKIKQGKLEDAFTMIKQQAVRHPEWPPARLVLARLLFAAEQPGAGRKALELAAVEAPDHPEVFLTLGSLALVENRLSDAWLNYKHAGKYVGGGRFSEEVAGRYQREMHEGLASVAENRDDLKAAERELVASLAIDAHSAGTRQRLARVLFRQGKRDEAQAALEQAVKENPRLEPAAISMAWLYVQQGDAARAAEWFEYGIKADANDARPLLARAAWLIDQEKPKDALRDLDAAEKLDPKSKDVPRLRGLVAWNMRELEQAERQLELLYREQPENLRIADLYALALVDQNDPVKRSRGLQVAESTVKRYPRAAEALSTAGWACYRTGKLGPAEQLLTAAVSNSKATPDVAYYLARVLADKSVVDQAAALLDSALKTKGSFAHRAEATELLKTLKKP